MRIKNVDIIAAIAAPKQVKLSSGAVINVMPQRFGWLNYEQPWLFPEPPMPYVEAIDPNGKPIINQATGAIARIEEPLNPDYIFAQQNHSRRYFAFFWWRAMSTDPDISFESTPEKFGVVFPPNTAKPPKKDAIDKAEAWLNAVYEEIAPLGITQSETQAFIRALSPQAPDLSAAFQEAENENFTPAAKKDRRGVETLNIGSGAPQN